MTWFIWRNSDRKQGTIQAKQTTNFPAGLSPPFLPVFSSCHRTDKSSLHGRKHSSQHVQWEFSWQIPQQAVPAGTHVTILPGWVVFCKTAQAKKKKNVLMHPFVSVKKSEALYLKSVRGKSRISLPFYAKEISEMLFWGQKSDCVSQLCASITPVLL